MGWWEQDREGHSFSTDEDDATLLWGDGPADILAAAVDKVIEEFKRDWGRLPTKTEVRAGLEFCLGGFAEEELRR